MLLCIIKVFFICFYERKMQLNSLRNSVEFYWMIWIVPFWILGRVHAIDINKGRLRILKETAKLHLVDDVITTIHADLRAFAVSCASYKMQKDQQTSLNMYFFPFFVDSFFFPLSRKIIQCSLIRFCWMLLVLDWVFSQRCSRDVIFQKVWQAFFFPFVPGIVLLLNF